MSANKPFRKVAIVARQPRAGIEDTLLTLYNYLLKQGYGVVFEAQTAKRLQDHSVPYVADYELKHHCEIIIVVGGDGSMLNAALLAIAQDLPVMGVNRGRLGFLTDRYPHELAAIEEILSGKYTEEHRILLTTFIKHNDEQILGEDALNDVVIQRDSAHMIEFDVMINGQFVCSHHADGLIVATPTGSTAYALSGGGPILHPQLDAILLLPMFPHTLSSRPIVIEANNEVVIHISRKTPRAPYISCDGRERAHIQPGDNLHIKRKPQTLRLIHPLDYNYFTTLREKLNWQSKTITAAK